jgi:hypothetical protein
MADDGPWDGPADDAVEPGRVTFADRERDEANDEPADLFAQEERPPKRLVLVVMVEEDAPDLVAALEADGVGARLGERTDDGGVEVLVHDTKLPAAQAVLVEFTGDPTLVDAVVEADEGSSEADDGEGFVEVMSGGVTGMSSQLERLRAAGIDVRVETDEGSDPLLATGALMVHPDDVERARAILGIAV